MSEKMRFAVIGAGVISKSHARSISAHSEAELVGIADVELEKANLLAAEYSIPQVYADYEQLLKRDDIDAVTIALPSGMHAEATIAAAQAGKHVLCEKPLDITSDNMTRMIAACRKANVKLGCVFQRRCSPTSIIAKKAIEEGKLGKLVLGDLYQKSYRSPEYYRSAGWRGTWALDGGGALMNQGVHGVDLLLWLMGGVHSVFAYSAPLLREIEVEDTAVAVLKYKNGAFGVIQGATSVYPRQQPRIELHGDNGTIAFDDAGFKQWKLEGRDEELPQAAPREHIADDPVNPGGHFPLVDDLIKAIREDRDPMITGEEARKAVDLILAIYESSRTGKEVILG